METKNLFLSLKTASETGTFRGLLSPYEGQPDQTGDIVRRGAYQKTMQETGGILPLLLAHDRTKQIGVVRLQDSNDGLYADGILNLQTQLAQEAHSNLLFNLKNGMKSNGLSIGYKALQSFKRQDGVRVLTEIKLYEASYTLFPAAEQALIAAAKHGYGSEFTEMVEAFGRQLNDAIRPAPPRLSPPYQRLIDDFGRKLNAIVRS